LLKGIAAASTDDHVLCITQCNRSFNKKIRGFSIKNMKEHRAQKSAFTTEDFPQKFKGLSAEKMKGCAVAHRLFCCSFIA